MHFLNNEHDVTTKYNYSQVFLQNRPYQNNAQRNDDISLQDSAEIEQLIDTKLRKAHYLEYPDGVEHVEPGVDGRLSRRHPPPPGDADGRRQPPKRFFRHNGGITKKLLSFSRRFYCSLAKPTQLDTY